MDTGGNADDIERENYLTFCIKLGGRSSVEA